MSTEADIVERLGDFDSYGLTATERFKLRMDAYNEINHLRAQRDAARADAYRAMCENSDLRAERDAAARDMRERCAKVADERGRQYEIESSDLDNGDTTRTMCVAIAVRLRGCAKEIRALSDTPEFIATEKDAAT